MPIQYYRDPADGQFKPYAPENYDHGSLQGLSDDDHPQYLQKSGGTMIGDLTINPSGTPADIYLLENNQRLWFMSRDSDASAYIVSSDGTNAFKRPLILQASKVLLAQGAESATDSNAVVPKSYVDKAYACTKSIQTATQAVSAGGTLPFDTVLTNVGSFVTTGNTIQVPIAGTYLVMTQLLVSVGSGDHRVYKNGALTNLAGYSGPVITGQSYVQAQSQGVLSLAANDVLTVYAQSAFTHWGGGGGGLAHNSFTVVRLGA